jgi:hypothetical protein
MVFKGRISMAEDHAYDEDLRLLREGTWIDWYLVENGTVISVWHPDRDGSRVASHGVNLITQDKNPADDHRAFEGCPTYGNPEEGNAHDRMAHEKFDFIHQYRKSYQAPNPRPIPLTLDIPCLYFSTLSCAYFIRRASFKADSETLQPYFILRDKSSRDCGIAQLHENCQVSELAENQTVQVLVPSHTAPGTARMFPTGELGIANGDCEGHAGSSSEERDIPTKRHNWDRLNVPVMRTLQEEPWVVERAGLGMVSKHSIASSLRPVRWRDMFLC